MLLTLTRRSTAIGGRTGLAEYTNEGDYIATYWMPTCGHSRTRKDALRIFRDNCGIWGVTILIDQLFTLSMLQSTPESFASCTARISLEAARASMDAAIHPISGSEFVPLTQALGRVLAADVT